MQAESLDNWGFEQGIKMSRQELVEAARHHYIRAENIRKANEQLVEKNRNLEAENAALKAEIAKLKRIAQDDADVIGGKG